MERALLAPGNRTLDKRLREIFDERSGRARVARPAEGRVEYRLGGKSQALGGDAVERAPGASEPRRAWKRRVLPRHDGDDGRTIRARQRRDACGEAHAGRQETVRIAAAHEMALRGEKKRLKHRKENPSTKEKRRAAEKYDGLALRFTSDQ